MTKLLLKANCKLHPNDILRIEEEIAKTLSKHGFAIIDSSFDVYEIPDEKSDEQ